MFGIVIPSGNEKELLEKAIALSITNVMFLYQTKNSNELNEKKKKFGANVGILFKPKNISDAKKINEKLYLEADLIAATSQDEKIIRALCENPMVDVVFGVATSFGKDALDYRRSGINAILANLMKQNKQSYAISFANILNEIGTKRAKLLGREMQNVQLTHRKVPLIIASFATKPEEMRIMENLSALLRILGANYPQSKAATSTAIENILKRKEARRSKTWVRAGVLVVRD
ncbi:MAG: hypothetical protein HYT16_01450 [DPANN group archaeon]|nr:hypothetical protein [DPANN group archaeon]